MQNAQSVRASVSAMRVVTRSRCLALKAESAPFCRLLRFSELFRLRDALRLFDRDGYAAGEAGGGAQFLLDAQQLVVLGDAVGARGGAGFDLPGAHSHH